jgi:hypothetical protein
MRKLVRGRGPLSVTAQQAMCDYLALNNERSLRRLARWYEESRTEFPPSYGTLAAWSRRDNWQRAAAEHDDFVGAALRSRLRETAVQQQFDRVTALNNVAQRSLDVAAETLRTASVSTASEVKALVSAAIDALKMIEVLTGGVTERRDDNGGGLGAEAMAILEQLAADKRAGIEMRMPREVDTLPARKQ